jgi:cellulose biosynthesis protein BcsQ
LPCSAGFCNGTTTIAVNLAVAAGVQTALFDLDQQESPGAWLGLSLVAVAKLHGAAIRLGDNAPGG